jgi:Flp pilus assembly pilin Flp
MNRVRLPGRKDVRLVVGVLKRLWQDDEGQDLVEYGLLLLLIACVCISSMPVVADTVINVFTNTASNLTSAAS